MRPNQFKILSRKLQARWRYKQRKKSREGRPFALGSLEMHLLLLLLYYRIYASQEFFSIWFGVDKSTICRSIKRIEPLVLKVVQLPKIDKIPTSELEKVLIDCTEQPIQRLKKCSISHLSGKRCQHTVKTEICMNDQSRIVRISKPTPGRIHDFKLFKQHPPWPEGTEIIVDLGYEGIQKMHKKVSIPIKRNRKRKVLTSEQKRHNRAQSSIRIRIEHKIRELKIFEILRDRFRNPLGSHGLKMGIIAGLVNMKNGF